MEDITTTFFTNSVYSSSVNFVTLGYIYIYIYIYLDNGGKSEKSKVEFLIQC